MSSRHPRNAGNTRAEIIAAATNLFGKRGYHHVTVGDICEATGLSRGGFYHHFANLKDCFEAVWKQLQDDWAAHTMSMAAEATAEEITDPWALLERTFRTLFSYWAEPSRRQINLYDPLPALGWERCQELQAENGMIQVKEMLELFGKIHDPMTCRLIFAAITEATFYVGRLDGLTDERDEAASSLVRLIQALPNGP